MGRDDGPAARPPLTHLNVVYAAAFSPDGKTVLTGSYDKTARLWDSTTGQPLGLPMTHHDRVYAVAFSPDGKAVFTGSGRQYGAAVGRDDRPAARPPRDSSGHGRGRGVQPGRQDRAHRER